MKPTTVKNIVAQPGYVSSLGAAVSGDQIARVSGQLVATGASAGGTFRLQCSNDQVFPPSVPTNWSNLGSSVSVSGAGAYLVPKTDVSYQWLRASFVSTSPGRQTITTVADVAGSLNNTYFLLTDSGDVNKYAVWFNVDGTGVAPVVPGYTSTEVDISAGDTADTIAAALAVVIDALATFTSSATLSVVTVVNTTIGTFTPAVDSVAAPTGFAFALSAANGTISVNLQVLGN